MLKWKSLFAFVVANVLCGLAHGSAECIGFANCTSVGSGDWNIAATWRSCRGSYPQCKGDVANIGPRHVITIPAGVSVMATVNYSPGTRSNFTTVVVHGTLFFGDDMSMVAMSALQCGAGGTIDLRGFNVNTSGTTKYMFGSGDVVNRCTISSSPWGGKFNQSGTYSVLSTWDGVNVRHLGDSVFGRGHPTVGAFQSFHHTLFEDCARLSLEAAGYKNGSIDIDGVDFRDPHPTNPLSAAAYQPLIDYSGQPLGTGTRSIKKSTWSRFNPTTMNIGTMFLRGLGMTMNNLVIADYQPQFLNVDTIYQNVFHSAHTSGTDPFALANQAPPIISNVYFYNSGASPHMLNPGGSNPLTVSGSVFETGIPTNGAQKWFSFGAGSNGTWRLHNNIFLGTIVSPLAIASDSSPPNLTPIILFYNNTIYVDERASVEGTPNSTMLRVEHPFGFLTGTQVEFYNNLTVKPNTATSQNVAISLWYGSPNQVTYLGYNTDFGEPSISYEPPPVLYTTGCPQGGANCAPYSVGISVTDDQTSRDFSANPQFADSTRNLATWDRSLGGPGTEAHALQEMLMMNGTDGTFNPAYTQAALLAFVQAGFVVRNRAFMGAGRNGTDIGALPAP